MDTKLVNGNRFFDTNDADWISLMDEVRNPAEPLGERRTEYLSMIHRAPLLVDPPHELSVIGVAFEPGFYIRTHYHDVDQYLLVIDGEFQMGRKRLHPGHIAYMPAGNPYNARVGRAGGTFLEFRERPYYRTAFLAAEAASVGPDAPTEIVGWKKPEPKKGRTVFMDAESHPALACQAFGPGDAAADVAPAAVSSIKYQALHAVPGYSMTGVVINGELAVPPHQQDADKVVYVLAGEITLNGAPRPLRPGCGMFLSRKTPIEFHTGPVGVRYLEFRSQSGWRTQWLS